MDASTMSIMMNLTSQLPVSPPPDYKQLFNQYPAQTSTAVPASVPVPGLARGFANPLLYKSLAMQMEAQTAKKEPTPLEKQQHQLLLQKMKQEAIQQARKQQQQPQQQQQQQQQQRTSSPQHPGTPSPTPSTNASSADTKVPPPSSPQQQQQQQSQQSQQPPSSPSHINFNLFNTGGDPTGSVDPKYVQMVSRMAAFYQQRCQAILNFQQQRCQTWANTHRQKCQEMMQAAMLVVAWYIRDRIGRRRRRQKRSFRRGLREKNSSAAARRSPKGETIRKWVVGIPEAALSPNNGIRDESTLDKEELAFDIEKEVTPDKDNQLFAVADQMIRSQMAKIDVPLLGALNMDESDSETGSDDDDAPGARYYYDDEEIEEDEEDGDGDVDDDDLGYEDETEEYVEDEVSQEALHGTGNGSSKRKRSESDIDTEQIGATAPQTKRIHKT